MISKIKFLTVFSIGSLTMIGTAWYMADGTERNYAHEQPAITPLGIFLGFGTLLFSFKYLADWGDEIRMKRPLGSEYMTFDEWQSQRNATSVSTKENR